MLTVNISGTTPEDGAGLLAGVLLHLADKGNECPKTVRASTMLTTAQLPDTGVVIDRHHSFSVSRTMTLDWEEQSW
jgi:hypothetical protein